MAHSETEDGDDGIEAYGEKLGGMFVYYGEEGDDEDPRKALQTVSKPRFGSDRLLIIGLPDCETPPPGMVDRVENDGYVFMDERTTDYGRWIAVIEPLSQRRDREERNVMRPALRARLDCRDGAVPAVLDTYVRQAVRATLGFGEARSRIESDAEQTFTNAREGVREATDALDPYVTLGYTLLGDDWYGLPNVPDAEEIAAMNLLARPHEAEYALECADEMLEAAERVADDISLSRTEARSEDESDAEQLETEAAKMLGNAHIIQNALRSFLGDNYEIVTAPAE